MKTLRTFPGQRVALGHQGENLALTVIFNIGAWADAYGPGTTHLVHMRTGDTEAYLVAVTQEGTEVSWEVSDADTAVDGYGKYELRYIVGETVVKSSVGETYVRKALQNGTETPEPVQGWLDHITEKEHGLLEAANTAKEHSEKASDSATNAAEYALKAKISEENAAKNVQEALKQAKESGEFDGKDGKDGKDGENGKDGQDGQDYVITEDDIEEIAEKAAGKIEIPEFSGSGVDVTAKPGQLIRVQTVDENGKPTAWEAVPWGYTEGGTTHPIPGELLPEGVPYVEKGVPVELIPESQMTLMEEVGGFALFTCPEIVEGKNYIINWNGAEYECTAILTDPEAGLCFCGNVGAMEPDKYADTGEPFVVGFMPGEMTMAIPLDGSTEVTLSVKEVNVTIQKMDIRCLPDDVSRVKYYDVDFELQIINSVTTASTTKTFAEISVKAIEPDVVVRGVTRVGTNALYYTLGFITTEKASFYGYNSLFGNETLFGITVNADDTVDFFTKTL